VLSSFNPVVCTALNWKQPNFSGAFFLFPSSCSRARTDNLSYSSRPISLSLPPPFPASFIFTLLSLPPLTQSSSPPSAASPALATPPPSSVPAPTPAENRQNSSPPTESRRIEGVQVFGRRSSLQRRTTCWELCWMRRCSCVLLSFLFPPFTTILTFLFLLVLLFPRSPSSRPPPAPYFHLLSPTAQVQIPSLIAGAREHGLLIATFGTPTRVQLADAHMADGVLSYATSDFLQQTAAS
jgi:hypothetical protein